MLQNPIPNGGDIRGEVIQRFRDDCAPFHHGCEVANVLNIFLVVSLSSDVRSFLEINSDLGSVFSWLEVDGGFGYNLDEMRIALRHCAAPIVISRTTGSSLSASL